MNDTTMPLEDRIEPLSGLLKGMPAGLHWDRILFCAKEATYKAWFPLTHRWLGFEDAHIVFDVDDGGKRLVVDFDRSGAAAGRFSSGGAAAPEISPDGRWLAFARQIPDGLRLHVLDSTDPGAVLEVERTVDLDTTLFIVSSKSGGTIETLSHMRYFYERSGGDGSHFCAVTDPGSPLVELARERGFRHVFENDPDIGGRYSVLSAFGLVPAACAGVNIEGMLHQAQRLPFQVGCQVGEIVDPDLLDAVEILSPFFVVAARLHLVDARLSIVDRRDAVLDPGREHEVGDY